MAPFGSPATLGFPVGPWLCVSPISRGLPLSWVLRLLALCVGTGLARLDPAILQDSVKPPTAKPGPSAHEVVARATARH